MLRTGVRSREHSGQRIPTGVGVMQSGQIGPPAVRAGDARLAVRVAIAGGHAGRATLAAAYASVARRAGPGPVGVREPPAGSSVTMHPPHAVDRAGRRRWPSRRCSWRTARRSARASCRPCRATPGRRGRWAARAACWRRGGRGRPGSRASRWPPLCDLGGDRLGAAASARRGRSGRRRRRRTSSSAARPRASAGRANRPLRPRRRSRCGARPVGLGAGGVQQLGLALDHGHDPRPSARAAARAARREAGSASTATRSAAASSRQVGAAREVALEAGGLVLGQRAQQRRRRARRPTGRDRGRAWLMSTASPACAAGRAASPGRAACGP